MPSGEARFSPEQRIETNDEVVRIQRALNQYKFYGIEDEGQRTTIDDLAGKPLLERLQLIRETLYPQAATDSDISFGTTKVSEHFSEILSRERWIPSKFYPEMDQVKDVLLPHLCLLVDSLAQRILQLPDDQRVATTARLAGMLYSFGVYLHPSADGNGQTFQTAVLSYIRELNPALKDRYFPIKYTQYYLPSHHRFTPPSDKIAELPMPGIDPKESSQPETVEQILAVRQALVKNNLDFEYDSRQSFEQNNIRQIHQQLDFLQQVSHLKPVQELLTNEFNDAYTLLDSAKGALAQYLLDLGYDPLVVRKNINGTLTLGEVATYQEKKALATQTGRELLSRYVLGLSVKDLLQRNPEFNQLWHVLLNDMTDVQVGIQEILDDDYVSSVAALKTQKTSAIVYNRMARRLHKQGLTSRWFHKILKGFPDPKE